MGYSGTMEDWAFGLVTKSRSIDFAEKNILNTEFTWMKYITNFIMTTQVCPCFEILAFHPGASLQFSQIFK
jgi:hypothetical protein